jgi:hypothetical protein
MRRLLIILLLLCAPAFAGQQRIIKNTTGSDITLESTGVTIVASGSYTIDPKSWQAWASATFDGIDLTTKINSGDLVVNNGTADLGATDGITLLRFGFGQGGGYVENCEAASTGESSSKSSSYQTKVTATCTLAGGRYIIHGHTMWSNEDTGVITKLRLRVNRSNYNNQWLELYNFKYEDGAYQAYHSMLYLDLSAGSNTFRLQYAATERKRVYVKESYVWAQKIGD